LGGSVVLNALSEEGDRALPFAAAAACVPFRLEPCVEHLRHGFARVYQEKMLKDLRTVLSQKHSEVPLPPSVDWQCVLQARDFIDFDNAFTAPLHGFRDARDYYAKCECGPALRHIRTPTLIVNAADDPLMVPGIAPAQSDLSPSITLEITRHGGHLGFVAAGPLGRPSYWLDQRLFRFLHEAQLGLTARPLPAARRASRSESALPDVVH
jgi:hypothetical protein